MKTLPAFALRITALALLSSCATLDTSSMTPYCRDQYDACLTSCQKSSPPRSRQPPDSVQGNAERLTPDTQTPSCVDSCNQQAKRCG